jgi:hypothetical protein
MKNGRSVGQSGERNVHEAGSRFCRATAGQARIPDGQKPNALSIHIWQLGQRLDYARNPYSIGTCIGSIDQSGGWLVRKNLLMSFFFLVWKLMGAVQTWCVAKYSLEVTLVDGEATVERCACVGLVCCFMHMRVLKEHFWKYPHDS